MSISVVCPQCGKSYDIPETRAGQTGKCACGATMTIPSPKKEVESPAAPWSQPVQPAQQPPPVEPRSPFGPTPSQNPYASNQVQSPYGPPPGQAPYGTPGSMGRPITTVIPTRPIALTILIIAMYVFVGIAMLGTIVLMTRASTIAPYIGAASIGMYIGACIFVLVLLTVNLLILHSLWHGRNWARITMIVLMSLNAAGNLMGMMGRMGNQNIGSYALQLMIAGAVIGILCPLQVYAQNQIQRPDLLNIFVQNSMITYLFVGLLL